MSVEILQKVNLFSQLDCECLGKLANKMTMRSYPKNAVLISEGDESDSLYNIISGKVKAFLLRM